MLTRADLARPVVDVAPELLGCVLRHGEVAVRITEVEAYAGEVDPGSHAFRGVTPRTRVMFGEAGHLYVYLSYGMHYAVNIVTGVVGEASAVLVRAGEIVAGHRLVEERRSGIRPRDWARGPGRLTKALGLDLTHLGVDLLDPQSSVRLEGPVRSVDRILSGPRVGVSGPGGDGEHFPWRFWAADDPTVSSYRAATPRRRGPRAVSSPTSPVRRSGQGTGPSSGN